MDKFKEARKEHGNEITLSAHMIIEYGNKAWVLYAGNHNILSETYVNYKTYYEHLKYCKEKGIEIYDQFGTIGDLSKNNPRLGLHEFKKKFGGDYVEFIGEWDYVTDPLFYFVFTKLVPIYKKIIRKAYKVDYTNKLCYYCFIVAYSILIRQNIECVLNVLTRYLVETFCSGGSNGRNKEDYRTGSYN